RTTPAPCLESSPCSTAPLCATTARALVWDPPPNHGSSRLGVHPRGSPSSTCATPSQLRPTRSGSARTAGEPLPQRMLPRQLSATLPLEAARAPPSRGSARGGTTLLTSPPSDGRS